MSCSKVTTFFLLNLQVQQNGNGEHLKLASQSSLSGS